MRMSTYVSWKRAAATVFIAGALMLSGASNAWSAPNENPGVNPPGSKPHGMSYPEWAVDWADWFLSIPLAQNPFADPDGRFCRVCQSGHVFFLANNFGGTTVRSCNLQPGQSFFFSPAGTFCIQHVDADTEEGLRACVEETLPLFTNLSVEIDGKSVNALENYRFVSPLFDFTLPADNLVGLPPGPYQAVIGGYFVMLAPLSSGQHVIHFHGEIPDFSFVFDVTYMLSIGSHS